MTSHSPKRDPKEYDKSNESDAARQKKYYKTYKRFKTEKEKERHRAYMKAYMKKKRGITNHQH